MQNSSQGKKGYQPPSCTQMPISEFALLVRRKTVANEVPTLIIEDYGGDLDFIQPVSRNRSRELGPSSIQRDVGWLEMQFTSVEGAEPQGAFLLLDLRYRRRQHRRSLELIGNCQNLDKPIPRVILATSSEPFLDWGGIDRKQCWQLPSCPTSRDLSTALLSFFCLCSMFTNGTAEEDTAPEPTPHRALDSDTNES